MYKILLVCTGNTCRSSMAEGILKELIEKYKIEDEIKVKSAGIMAFDGMAANDKALKTLNDEYQIDIRNHSAQQIDETLMDEADIILTMTDNHRDLIIASFPSLKDKIYTLIRYLIELKAREGESTEYAHTDIPDPIGGGLLIYKKTANQLMEVLEQLIQLKFWQK